MFDASNDYINIDLYQIAGVRYILSRGDVDGGQRSRCVAPLHDAAERRGHPAAADSRHGGALPASAAG